MDKEDNDLEQAVAVVASCQAQAVVASCQAQKVPVAASSCQVPVVAVSSCQVPVAASSCPGTVAAASSCPGTAVTVAVAVTVAATSTSLAVHSGNEPRNEALLLHDRLCEVCDPFRHGLINIRVCLLFETSGQQRARERVCA